MAQITNFFKSDTISDEDLNTLPFEILMVHVGQIRAYPLQSLMGSATYNADGTKVEEKTGNLLSPYAGTKGILRMAEEKIKSNALNSFNFFRKTLQ